MVPIYTPKRVVPLLHRSLTPARSLAQTNKNGAAARKTSLVRIGREESGWGTLEVSAFSNFRRKHAIGPSYTRTAHAQHNNASTRSVCRRGVCETGHKTRLCITVVVVVVGRKIAPLSSHLLEAVSTLSLQSTLVHLLGQKGLQDDCTLFRSTLRQAKFATERRKSVSVEPQPQEINKH